MGSIAPLAAVAPKLLFTPIKIGKMQLKHRVVLAPLTRNRSPGGVPTDVVREYYEQRASDGGLLITEGTHISMMGGSYTNVPGIYTPEQIRAWKKITDAVHAKGGYIFTQLWHVGRTTHPDNIGGRLPLAPSAVLLEGGKVGFTAKGMQDTVTPKAMTLEEVQDTISDYAHAAKCAIAAGFDGVELHGANGYLIDQFINSNINLRTDAYGGDRVKRARFAVEVVDAVIAALDGDAARVGIRFSPFGTFQGTNTEDPVMDYGYVMSQLDNKGLAYIHLIEPGGGSGSYFGMPDYKLDILKAGAASRGVTNLEDEVSLKPFRKILKHTTLLGNGAYLSSGGADVEDRLKEGGLMDAAVYGRYFISNPDLPERLRLGRELNAYDRTTFYSHGREGYTDYPTWDELQAQKEKSRI